MQPLRLAVVKHRGSRLAAARFLAALALLSIAAIPRRAEAGPGPPGVTQVSMTEGDVGTKTYSFVFTSPVAGPFHFDYLTQDGSARVSDGDYVPISGGFDLPAGQYQHTFDVTVRSDSTHEGDEVFNMVVTSPNTAIYSGAGTIVNDDQQPRILIDDVTVAEGNAGTTQVTVWSRLDRASYQEVRASFGTIDGTATLPDMDYAYRSGSVVFPPGTRTFGIPLSVYGDVKIEVDESFAVNLWGPIGGFIGDPTAYVTIANDDVVAFPTVHVTRPDGGEALVQGEQETISWEANTPTVDAQISRDGGATWQVLGQNVYNVGYSFWKGEGPTTNQALIKVIARDALGRMAEDVSDATFYVVNDASRLPTHASLAVTPEAPVCGDRITLTAFVTPVAATGVVSFTRNGVPIGSAPLDASGHAEFQVAPLPIGTHTLQGRYEGDFAYARSTTQVVSVTLIGTMTTTSLLPPPSPSACGEPLRLEATVAPSTASGNVAFRDGNVSLGLATIVGGSAVLTTSVLGVGSHTLTAQYVSDGCHLTSTSSSLSRVIEKKTTTVAVTPTPSPSNCGSAVQIQAVVSPSSATGTVVFKDGTTTIATLSLVGASATYTTPSLAKGSHTLSAQYLGDGCHLASTSASVPHLVQGVPTDTDLLAQRVACGVRLTASLSPLPGAGSVLFREDEQDIGTVAVDGAGQAVLNLATILPGTHTFDARFLGNLCYNASDAPQASLNTDNAPTATSLTPSPSPGLCGGIVTLHASVTPAGALGSVRFFQDGVSLGFRVLDVNGIAELAFTPAATGSHTYRADYLGSGCYQASSSPDVAHGIDPNPGAVVTLAATPNPAKLGDVLTLDVTVVPSVATGTAEIFEGHTSFGVMAISAGHGSRQISGLSQGDHLLRARYSGEACLLGADSSPIAVTVGDPPRVSIDDAQILEGAAGTRMMEFRLVLSSTSSSNVTVGYRTVDGTAHSNADYVSATGTATIQAGSQVGQILISVVGETIAEPNETFEVRLSSPTIAVVEDSVGIGAILDDDSGPPPPPGITSLSVVEGDIGTTAFHFNFVSPVIGPASFKIYTQENSARLANGDYVPLDDSLHVPFGLNQVPITVYVNGDSTTESDERFFLIVTNDQYNYFGIGTIVNDDPLPRLTIEDASVLEGGPGTTTVAQVVVRADRGSSASVSVHYDTRNGSATTAGNDYSGASGTLAIDPKSRTGIIPVTIRGDAVVEPAEYLTVSLSSPAGAYVQDGLASVTILADDAGTPPAVRVTEPNGGEVLMVATQARVAWVSTDNATIDVSLSRDGGSTWELLGQNLFNVGYAYWKVEGPPTVQARIKVLARDYVGRIVEDQSDASFTIVDAGSSEPPNATLVGVFEAKAVGRGVELKWQLAESPKTEAVEIQRRESGAEAWTAIVAEAREVDGMHVALDTDVDPGNIYSYRLSARLEGGHEVRFDAPPVVIAGAPNAGPGIRLVPNPTHGPARIDLTLARDGPVRLVVIDVLGREVAVLRAGPESAGRYVIEWDGRGTRGAVPAGLYFVRCEADGAAYLRRFAVVR
jgi:hypothetical protein